MKRLVVLAVALIAIAALAVGVLFPDLFSVGGRARLMQDRLSQADKRMIDDLDGTLRSQSTREPWYAGASVEDGTLTVWLTDASADNVRSVRNAVMSSGVLSDSSFGIARIETRDEESGELVNVLGR